MTKSAWDTDREVIKAATEGPWEAVSNKHVGAVVIYQSYGGSGNYGGAAPEPPEYDHVAVVEGAEHDFDKRTAPAPQSVADAAFIARARERWPATLEELDKANERIQELEASADESNRIVIEVMRERDEAHQNLLVEQAAASAFREAVALALAEQEAELTQMTAERDVALAERDVALAERNRAVEHSTEMESLYYAALAEVERVKDGIKRHTEDMDGLARDIGIWGKQQHADELIEMYDGLRALLNPDTPEADHE